MTLRSPPGGAAHGDSRIGEAERAARNERPRSRRDGVGHCGEGDGVVDGGAVAPEADLADRLAAAEPEQLGVGQQVRLARLGQEVDAEVAGDGQRDRADARERPGNMTLLPENGTFDMLQDPDRNIRLGAFAFVSSMLTTKDKRLLDEQDKKQLVQKFVDGWVDLQRNTDIDQQFISLYFPRSLVETIIQIDEDQSKRLKEVFINLQKSPNKQIRDFANKTLDFFKYPESC